MQQLVERLSVSRKSVASRLKRLKEKGTVERVSSVHREYLSANWKLCSLLKNIYGF